MTIRSLSSALDVLPLESTKAEACWAIKKLIEIMLKIQRRARQRSGLQARDGNEETYQERRGSVIRCGESVHVVGASGKDEERLASTFVRHQCAMPVVGCS
jgi:hypothetical protein